MRPKVFYRTPSSSKWDLDHNLIPEFLHGLTARPYLVKRWIERGIASPTQPSVSYHWVADSHQQVTAAVRWHGHTMQPAAITVAPTNRPKLYPWEIMPTLVGFNPATRAWEKISNPPDLTPHHPLDYPDTSPCPDRANNRIPIFDMKHFHTQPLKQKERMRRLLGFISPLTPTSDTFFNKLAADGKLNTIWLTVPEVFDPTKPYSMKLYPMDARAERGYQAGSQPDGNPAVRGFYQLKNMFPPLIPLTFTFDRTSTNPALNHLDHERHLS